MERSLARVVRKNGSWSNKVSGEYSRPVKSNQAEHKPNQAQNKMNWSVRRPNEVKAKRLNQLGPETRGEMLSADGGRGRAQGAG